MNLAQLVIQVVVTALTAAVLVGWFSGAARDPKEVGTWAKSHGLELTAANRPMVTYYVRLAIVLRVTGGVGGLVLGGLFDDATGLDTSASAGFWVWIILGWLVGASWAEYRLTRPASTGGVASLVPRSVTDYLPSGLAAAPVVAAVATGAVAIAGLLAPTPVRPQVAPAPAAAFWLALVGSAAIAAGITLAVRTVVARRQPTGAPDVVAADDAIRASAVHHLAGGGAAAILLIGAQTALSLLEPHQLPFGVRAWVPALFLLGALLAWRFFAYRAWRVQRPVAALAP